MSVESESSDFEPGRSHFVTAFLTGVLVTLLVIVAGLYLNEGTVSEFRAGRLELLAVGLFIGSSTGHYIGQSVGGRTSVIKAAAVGVFLTSSIGFVYMGVSEVGLSSIIGPGAILIISTFVYIFGYHSRVLEEGRPIEKMIERFAAQFSPLFLAFIWLVEAIVPPVIEISIISLGISPIGGNFLNLVQLGVALIITYILYSVIKQE